VQIFKANGDGFPPDLMNPPDKVPYLVERLVLMLEEFMENPGRILSKGEGSVVIA